MRSCQVLEQPLTLRLFVVRDSLVLYGVSMWFLDIPMDLLYGIRATSTVDTWAEKLVNKIHI